MSVNAIHFGNLSAIRSIRAQQPIDRPQVAQNFKKNYCNGELTPVVKNDVLANKLDLFA